MHSSIMNSEMSEEVEGADKESIETSVKWKWEQKKMEAENGSVEWKEQGNRTGRLNE